VVLVTTLVYYSGCSQSIFTVIFFFPVIAGSFILPRYGGIALAAASTMGYSGVLLAEYFEYYPLFFHSFWYRPLNNIQVVLNYVSIHAVSFFMASILSSRLSKRLLMAENALTQTNLEYDHLTILYKQIFDDAGFSGKYEDKLKGSYSPREYCVQYRETDFNFVSRLMEEEGIYYFFKHEDGDHKLVLAENIKVTLNTSFVEPHDPFTLLRTKFNFEPDDRAYVSKREHLEQVGPRENMK